MLTVMVMVGTLADAEPPPEHPRTMPSDALSRDEKRSLLLLARASLARTLGFPIPEPSLTDRVRTEKRGAFVTIRKDGELRGCIGYVEPVEPIAEAIRQLSVKAALEDPRFDPVSPPEFDRLVFECSVLTPLRPCTDPYALRIGVDGLVVESLGRRGLLRPEVAVEAGWNATEFLEHTCIKAGLSRHAWQDRNARLFIFQTEHFAESIGESA